MVNIIFVHYFNLAAKATLGYTHTHAGRRGRRLKGGAVANDHDALLAAVCENTAEDTPRLAYADWLEENADDSDDPGLIRARAGFIRTDIAMSLRAEWDADRLRWDSAVKPAAERRAWPVLPPVPEGRVHWNEAPLCRRGFPNCLAFILLHGGRLPAIRDCRMPVDRVIIACRPTAARSIAAARWLAGVCDVAFIATEFTAAEVARLTAAPLFRRVEACTLACDAVTPDGLRALCESEAFGRLTSFGFRGSPTSTDLPEVLSSLAGPTGWRRLRLENLTVGWRRLRRLLMSPAVRGLEEFEFLGGREVSRSRFEAVASTPLPGLRRLTLGHAVLPEGVMRMLAASPVLAGLEQLRLPRCRLEGINAVRYLHDCPALAGLRVLDLSGNEIGEAAAILLFRSPWLAGLKVLNLSHCGVSDHPLRVLLDQSPLADGLNSLDLTGSAASDDLRRAVKNRMRDRVRI